MPDLSFIFLYLFPILGNICAIFLFLSPMTEIIEKRKKKENGHGNYFPFLLMFSQCIAWICYSIVISAPLIGWINMVGMAVALFYVLSALRNVKNEKEQLYADLQLVVALLVPACVFIIVEYWVADADMQIQIMGICATVLNIIFYSSPMSTIISIIRERDASSISIPLAITVFFNSACWGLYGIGINSLYLLIASAVGFGMAIVQLIVVVYFQHIVAATGNDISGDQVIELTNKIYPDASPVKKPDLKIDII